MAGVAVSLNWTGEQFEIVADKNEQYSEISAHFCDRGRLFCQLMSSDSQLCALNFYTCIKNEFSEVNIFIAKSSGSSTLNL